MDKLEVISKKIQEEIEAISNDLVRGNAKDIGEYKYACGRYYGLMMANGFVVELAQQEEDFDD